MCGVWNSAFHVGSRQKPILKGSSTIDMMHNIVWPSSPKLQKGLKGPPPDLFAPQVELLGTPLEARGSVRRRVQSKHCAKSNKELIEIPF